MSAIFHQAQRSPLFSWLLDNPLLVREIRRRMRGKLFSWSLILYVLALGGVSVIIMLTTYPADADKYSLRDLIQKVGQIGASLFAAMRALEMIIALGIAPLLTAGLASSEKEKDTFDFLRVTTLHASTFVSGCLLTTGCFLILVFCCTLPVMGLTFIFGGISLREVLGFNVALFAGAMAICAMGIFISTNYQRSVSVLGSLAALLMLALFIGGFSTISRVFSPGAGVFSTVGAGGWGPALTIFGGPLVVTLIFAVGAARRLYEPNARIFNYKQFTGFYLVLLAALAGTGLYSQSRGGTQAQLGDAVTMFAAVGAVLNAIAILVFTAGRVERGDEVWRIRLRRPIFQTVNDDLLVGLIYAGFWLGGSYLLAHTFGLKASGSSMKFLNVLAITGGTGLIFAYSTARCMSGFFESRNRAMLAAGLVLLLAWGVTPLLGGGGNALMGTLGMTAPGLRQGFDLLISLSPIGALTEEINNSGAAPILTAAAQLLFAVAIFIPTRTAVWRARMKPSYVWIEAPSQGAAQQWTGPTEAR